MKGTLGLFVGLLVSSQAAFAADSISTVPFTLGPQHFRIGDSIVIEQVEASTPHLTTGDTVTVRGRYVLKSVDRAELALFLTTSGAGGTKSAVPRQETTVINKGSGSFELTNVLKDHGHLHLAFYPFHGGSDFGTVYFGTAQQMKEISHWDVSQ